MNYQMT